MLYNKSYLFIACDRLNLFTLSRYHKRSLLVYLPLLEL
nr:MAG TPA: hypothetical protein [Caudoviricetes sp.]